MTDEFEKEMRETHKCTYSLNLNVIATLEILTERLSHESRVKIPMSKVVEFCILYCENKSFSDLVSANRDK